MAARSARSVLKSATLDTNVYISALHFGGAGAVLLGAARAGLFRLDVSDAIVNETIRVLRDKFQWDGYRLQNAKAKILSLGNHIQPMETLNVIEEDPDDNRILECACEARSDFLVTRDKDLLRLARFRGTDIVPPERFLATVGQNH